MPARNQAKPKTRAELEEFSGRHAPTEAERRIAARVVARANQVLKVETPRWIQVLADRG